MSKSDLTILDQPSANWNERPEGCPIDTLLIHSMFCPDAGECAFDEERCMQELARYGVSAHYVIGRQGALYRLVSEEKRAWHAGVSALPEAFGRRAGVNDFSIGIEIIGSEDFTDIQYEALAKLTAELRLRFPLRYVLGHEDVALPKGRKSDPGPAFDWARYQKLMLQHGASDLVFYTSIPPHILDC